MKLSQQKNKFDIPEDITYLNIASLSPSFKAIEQAGIEGVLEKSRPYKIPITDFFEPVTHLKSLFAELIDTDEPERIVTIPSVSYGMATVANNIELNEGDEIIVVDEQFPSNIYAWQKLANKYNAKLITVTNPSVLADNAIIWNQNILEAINERTALIALGNIHWSNGTIFDLKAIRERSRLFDALLVIDGSQTIGAFPFSINEIQPDAMICAGYKWLFGPYGCAYAYYGPYFDNGEPIENNWGNRLGSENFAGLTNYEPNYKPLANRYAVGESGSFIYIKMQTEAIKQVIQWTPEAIQDYCKSISNYAASELERLGCTIENPEYRSHHLFGVQLPEHIPIEKIKTDLREKNVFVSYRGNYMRLSCHLYNTSEDFGFIIDSIKNFST